MDMYLRRDNERGRAPRGAGTGRRCSLNGAPRRRCDELSRVEGDKIDLPAGRAGRVRADAAIADELRLNSGAARPAVIAWRKAAVLLRE